MVKGGTEDLFRMRMALSLISTSPVGILGFLLWRSSTSPVAWITNSRPREAAVSTSAASASASTTSCVMP